IIYLATSNLCQLSLPASFDLRSNSVRPDYCASVNDHPRTDNRSFPTRDIGIIHTTAANFPFMPDIASGADHRLIADCCPRFDDGVRLDRYPPAKLRAWLDNRCRVSARQQR